MWPEKESRVWVGKKAKAGGLTRLHPHQMLTYLLLTGVVVVFAVLLLAFTGAQLYTVKQIGVHMPVTFWYSTGTLLLSSYTMWLARRAQKAELYQRMTIWLSSTLALGVLFLALQLIGWNELQLEGIYLGGAASGSYLYLISGLHMLHIIGGLGFAVLVMSHSIKASLDAVGALVYSTDKYRTLQMRLLGTYWHFMDGLWLAMFLLFLVLLR